MTSPLRLPFDVYQRYRLVADVLGRLRDALPGKTRLRVLDVGGRTAVLREFDAEDAIALVDVEPLEGVAGLVLGDGCKLPFADDAFDVVCAFDTLEHVPEEKREAFVDECARVAGRWVVLAGPYDAERVAEAERTLERFLKDKLKVEHRYLKEHRDFGLPDRAAVERRLEQLGAQVKSLGHANLDRWLVLMCLAFYLDYDPELRGLAASFFEFYNERLYASDHAEPVYRHAVIAAVDGAALPDLKGLLDPPRAPEGAIEPFARLAEELLVFDKERGMWDAERAKLGETIATLEEDLREHAKSIGELEKEKAELGAGVAELEEEVARERKESEEAAEEARSEIEARDGRIAELGGELDAAKGEIEGLTHRAGEKEALAADLESKLGHERDQVAQRDAELERLGEDFRSAQAEASAQREELEGRLAEHREVLAARDVQVAEQQEHIGNLEAHLRDRNAELKRWPMAALRRVMWLFGGKPPTV